MNIPKYSLENKKVIYFFLMILLVGGVLSFFKLPKKEDSPFIIKTAALVTRYPGATALEVEELVTEPIEREIQSMGNVYKIKSESYPGLSKILIELEPSLPAENMPVKWDELRRKVMNVQPSLPHGASAISVSDDFGDVFGIYYALVADEGFSFKDLRDWAQRLKKELTPINGVQKVSLFGEQTQTVDVNISIPKLANLGIDPNSIKQILSVQNQLVNTGMVDAGAYQLKIRAEGTYKSIDDIRNQIIMSKKGSEVRLGDIANVKRGYYTPANTLMRVNGKRAIGVGVATGLSDDVVAVGDAVTMRLEQIKPLMPIGMEMVSLYPENVIANDANNGFIINLVESLLIVIVIIFMVMGARAGLLIGSSLLFSVGGTLLIMLLMNVGLNRTSLAAFIIAMGMLVDNAIVVTDNAQIGVMRGIRRYKSLIDGAQKPQWGLLGATLIAICSFLPLYLAPASVAEIVKPLFIVLAVSLGLSWILALTQTTTFGNFILKDVQEGAEAKDPYDKPFYHSFERVLSKLIRRRYITLGSVVAVLFFSIFIMSLMPQSFFPMMNKPYFRGDLIFPEGTTITYVEEKVKEIETYLDSNDKIKSYSFTLGGTPPRYYLASSSVGPKSNFANVLIETHDARDSKAAELEFYEYMLNTYPEILTRSSVFALSPVPDATIEITFKGPNVDTLAALTERAKAIAQKCDKVMEIRGNWGTKVPVWKPTISQEKGLRLGITRQQVAYSISAATSGVALGEYREGDVFMPILMKYDNIDMMNLNDLRSLPVYSAKGKTVKLEQVIDNFKLDYEYNVVRRYNRQRMMAMQCEPLKDSNTSAAFQQVWQAVNEELTIPEGYEMSYMGEQESQDDSNTAIGANVPLMFLIIYVVLLLLFPSNYRKPVLIIAMLPLIFIGIIFGLVMFGKSMDFFAILGVLGLIGMNIKNAIVLVDEIDIQMQELSPISAVIQATKTRIIPVVMASGTTILGMLPLLADAMFAGMAATIMGGLFVSTVLTIFVLPVAYCIFFKLKIQK